MSDYPEGYVPTLRERADDEWADRKAEAERRSEEEAAQARSWAATALYRVLKLAVDSDAIVPRGRDAGEWTGDGLRLRAGRKWDSSGSDGMWRPFVRVVRSTDEEQLDVHSVADLGRLLELNGEALRWPRTADTP